MRSMGGGQLRSTAGFVNLHTCLSQGLQVLQLPAVGATCYGHSPAGLSHRQGCTQQACPRLCQTFSASCKGKDVRALQMRLEAALLLLDGASSGPIPACREHFTSQPDRLGCKQHLGLQ